MLFEMIAWDLGGVLGSINRYVKRDVREQIRENDALGGARYSLPIRLLRFAYGHRSFSWFLAIYLLVDIAVVGAEAGVAHFAPDDLPQWAISTPPRDIKSLLDTFAGYLIATQVGVLGVVSIAVALVTLIAQREESSTDVKVYYHASMAFEVVASGIALLVVLSIQLMWPAQFALHKFDFGTDSQFFKLFLFGLHALWLIANLAALAQFVSITFKFVQRHARERLREIYTANELHEMRLTRRMRVQLYQFAGTGMIVHEDEEDELTSEPRVQFGYGDGVSEIELNIKHPVRLHDVRVLLVQYVARRWAARCRRQENQGNLRPVLSFPIYLDEPSRGNLVWCRRRGGVPLTRLEKKALSCAFRFKRVTYEA